MAWGEAVELAQAAQEATSVGLRQFQQFRNTNESQFLDGVSADVDQAHTL